MCFSGVVQMIMVSYDLILPRMYLVVEIVLNIPGINLYHLSEIF